MKRIQVDVYFADPTSGDELTFTDVKIMSAVGGVLQFREKDWDEHILSPSIQWHIIVRKKR
jgi:hypothetical protein